jgi:hypothetical protein
MSTDVLEEHIVSIFRVEEQSSYRLHLQGGRAELCFPPAFTVVSCSAYSTMKMEAICSSKTLVDIQRTTLHYIPEDSTLQVSLCLVSHAGTCAAVYKQNWNNLTGMEEAVKWRLPHNYIYICMLVIDPEDGYCSVHRNIGAG